MDREPSGRVGEPHVAERGAKNKTKIPKGCQIYSFNFVPYFCKISALQQVVQKLFLQHKQLISGVEHPVAGSDASRRSNLLFCAKMCCLKLSEAEKISINKNKNKKVFPLEAAL